MDEFNEYNAMTAGVEPGGLRNAAQIRLLIGYLVKNLPEPVKKEQIIEVLSIDGIANYFEVTQAFETLLSDGNITSGDDDYLTLTETGKTTVDELENDLPRSVRDKALEEITRLQVMERRMSENRISITPNGRGYDVTFIIEANGVRMMQLTVFAADSYQAQKIKDNFLNDPAGLYSGVVASLFM